jgi:hypothetical protein
MDIEEISYDKYLDQFKGQQALIDPFVEFSAQTQQPSSKQTTTTVLPLGS